MIDLKPRPRASGSRKSNLIWSGKNTRRSGKKDMIADTPGDDPKAKAVTVAKRLFPEAVESLKLKKDHGKADAILLAAWGARRA